MSSDQSAKHFILASQEGCSPWRIGSAFVNLRALGGDRFCFVVRRLATARNRRDSHFFSGDARSDFGATVLYSSDFFRGMLSDFHSLDLKCLARNTICPA